MSSFIRKSGLMHYPETLAAVQEAKDLNLQGFLSEVLIVQSDLKTSTIGLNQAIDCMTTGFKINQAEDNAANYSINTKLTSGTYSISTAEELAKLATMTNNYKICSNCEFVLADDIDLSAYSTGEGWTPIGTSNQFTATFDGNGYVISNLYINTPSINCVGLFRWCNFAEIKNVGLENVDVTGDYEVGGLMGRGCNVTISNS